MTISAISLMNTIFPGMTEYLESISLESLFSEPIEVIAGQIKSV